MERPKISKEQADLAFKFLKLLFSEDVQGLWDTISKADQSRIYGMYKQYISNENSIELTFIEYIMDVIKPDLVVMFEELRENAGIASDERYTDEGEALVYMLPHIETSITYIAESEEKVFPLAMTVDTNYEQGKLSSEWRIRLYQDQDYRKLN